MKKQTFAILCLLMVFGCKFTLGDQGNAQNSLTPIVKNTESTPLHKDSEIDSKQPETAKHDNNSDDDSGLMKGTENAEFSNDNCYVYKDFVVKIKQSEDGGSTVSVYSRGSGADQQVCRSPGPAILTVPDEDNNSFYGIYGNYLFIDQGTSASSRSLPIFDLETGRSVAKLDYFDEIVLDKGRYLEFNALTTSKGDPKSCKNYAEWKRNGDVVWVQLTRYDLFTNTSVKVGGLKCAYTE